MKLLNNLLIIILLSQYLFVNCSYDKSDQILDNVKITDAPDYAVGQHTSNDIVSISQNLYGVAYVGTNQDLYASFISFGEVQQGSPSQKINVDIGEIQASNVCKVGTDQMMVVYTLCQPAPGPNEYKVYIRLVNIDGSFASNENLVSVPPYTNHATLGKCIQIDTDKVLVSFTQNSINEYDEAFRIYDITNNNLNTIDYFNDIFPESQGYGIVGKISDNRYIDIYSQWDSTFSAGQGLYLQEFNELGQKHVDGNIFVTGSEAAKSSYPKLSPTSDGGFMMVYQTKLVNSLDPDTVNEIRVVKYDSALNQECQATLATGGTRPDIEVYEDIAYILYALPDSIKGLEVNTSCDIVKAEQNIVNQTISSVSANQSLSFDGNTAIIGIFYKVGSNPYALYYTEYLIDFKGVCTDSRCTACYYDVDSCPLCVGSTSLQKSIRTRGSGDCSCIDGYLDIEGELDCKICNFKCDLCETTVDNCRVCHGTTRGTAPLCECQYNYYEANQEDCLPCHDSCTTCSGGLDTQCLSCQQGEYLDENNSCMPCDSSCTLCVDDTVCCKYGFFRNSDLNTCEMCDESCSSCKDNTPCCSKGTFLNSEKNLCEQCGEICDSCSDSFTCDECRNGGIGPYCAVQKSGFFSMVQDNSLIYQECEKICLTCSYSAENCTSCEGNFRNVENSCKCQEKFKENSQGDCEFIPCKKNHYEYNYECYKCFWVQDSDICHTEGCPINHEANYDTFECTEAPISLIWLIIFIVIALIVMAIIIHFIIKYVKVLVQKKASQYSQNEPLKQQKISQNENDKSQIDNSKQCQEDQSQEIISEQVIDI